MGTQEVKFGLKLYFRLNQLNELDDFHLRTYEHSILYKKRMKMYHDHGSGHWKFILGDLILLFNSRMWLFSRKLKSKWFGSYKTTHVFNHRVVELEANIVQGSKSMAKGSNHTSKSLRK